MGMSDRLFLHCPACKTRRREELLEVVLTAKTLTVGCKTCGKEIAEITPKMLEVMIRKMRHGEFKPGDLAAQMDESEVV